MSGGERRAGCCWSTESRTVPPPPLSPMNEGRFLAWRMSTCLCRCVCVYVCLVSQALCHPVAAFLPESVYLLSAPFLSATDPFSRARISVVDGVLLWPTHLLPPLFSCFLLPFSLSFFASRL